LELPGLTRGVEAVGGSAEAREGQDGEHDDDGADDPDDTIHGVLLLRGLAAWFASSTPGGPLWFRFASLILRQIPSGYGKAAPVTGAAFP
jgi:hypothetical protein